MNNKIWAIVFRQSPMFVIFVVLSFILSNLLIYGAGIISNAVDAMPNGIEMDIKYLISSTALIIVMSIIVSYLKILIGESYSIKIQYECRDMAVKAIQGAKYSQFSGNSGAVINRLTLDIGDMNKLLSEIIPDIISYFITIVTVGISIFNIEWRIFAGVVIAFPVIIPISNVIAKRINELAKSRKGRYDELTEIATDNIAGIEVCRIYGIEEHLGKRIDVKSNEILQNEYARNAYQALANFATRILRWVPSIICSLIALALVRNNIMTVGQLMAFVILFGKITTPLCELPFRIIDAREMLISVERINSIINVEQENAGSYADVEFEQRGHVIKCNGITFSYNTVNNVLDNVNLEVSAGEKIAIVGGSGSGKTTLIKILCGFEQPQAGGYELYEHDFSEWDINDARKLISFVPQDIFLFPGTIVDNVALGSEVANLEAKMKKVISACRKAGIHERIIEFPNGYETLVGKGGVTLSGGEKQRLAIARALYKDAPIILMDEPTSALDEKTEQIICDTLTDKCSSKTMIIIAHRLSTIKNADRIYVMNYGTIVESGTHEELIARQGVYAMLYNCANVDGGCYECI